MRRQRVLAETSGRHISRLPLARPPRRAGSGPLAARPARVRRAAATRSTAVLIQYGSIRQRMPRGQCREDSTFRLQGRFTGDGQLLLSRSEPVASSPRYRSMSVVSAPFWHATGTRRALSMRTRLTTQGGRSGTMVQLRGLWLPNGVDVGRYGCCRLLLPRCTPADPLSGK